MSYLLRFFCILTFSSFAYGQFYQYEINGIYNLDSPKKERVNFNLKWSENKGKIKGLYSDNFFIDIADVTGQKNKLGRNFVVSLPQSKNGVRSITILTSDASIHKGSVIPVGIITRDVRGNPLTNTNVNSNFNSLSLAQKQEEQDCVQGLGVLSGYCGVYGGIISEDQDRRNKCNLLYADAVKIELKNDSSLVIHLVGEVNPNVETPKHEVGRIPSEPQSKKIDVMSRTCKSLMGVNSSGMNCKQLNLRGEFSVEGIRKHFTGIYTIKEENTNNLCQYSFSLDLQG